MSNNISPVIPKERYIILDALRGLALFGICLANYPEFSLYTFQSSDVVAAMPTAGIDTVVKYLQYFFIDGKFYTIFSILFGIGFSIILSNAGKKGKSGSKVFYRRTMILFLIGLFHLIFLWAGDILILYAFAGFFLPLFINTSNKKLLIYAVIFLAFPVAVDACVEIFSWNLSAPVIAATEYFHGKAGITWDTFPVWLVEKNTYTDIFKFNIAGSFIRLQEFIDGNRLFKVMGLFLLGFYIGRNRLYASLEENQNLLKKILRYGLLLGVPANLLYAYSAMNGHPFGLTVHSVIYTISVVPLGVAYMCMISLNYIRNQQKTIFRYLAAPGRMALTNYLMQSVIGIIIFYGIGFKLGARTGLIYVELIAAGVFGLQVIYSLLWFKNHQFGPLEWGWRMLTYGKRLKLKK